MLCGDFNSRCGGEADYIEGIDDIIERNVVDYKKNHYGNILLDFLISSNCVMLNGRHVNNDFTSVSTKGLAVVDYVVVSHQELTRYVAFWGYHIHLLYNNLLSPNYSYCILHNHLHCSMPVISLCYIIITQLYNYCINTVASDAFVISGS